MRTRNGSFTKIHHVVGKPRPARNRHYKSRACLHQITNQSDSEGYRCTPVFKLTHFLKTSTVDPSLEKYGTVIDNSRRIYGECCQNATKLMAAS